MAGVAGEDASEAAAVDEAAADAGPEVDTEFVPDAEIEFEVDVRYLVYDQAMAFVQ